MFPWGAMDHSVIMGHPPSYPFPVPVPIASGPIAIHPSMPPYHYLRGPNPGAYPAYTPYSTTSNHQGDQPSNQQNNPNPPPSCEQSHDTSEKDCGSKLSDNHTQSGAERREDFSDVPTELELKTPGSTGPSSLSQVAHDQVHSLIILVLLQFSIQIVTILWSCMFDLSMKLICSIPHYADSHEIWV